MSQPLVLQSCTKDEPVVLLDIMERSTGPENVLLERCDNELIEIFRSHQDAASSTEDLAVKTEAEQAAANVWGELYRRYVSVVYTKHLRNTGQHESAEDLTQETFERAMRGIDTYGRHDKSGNFGGWLHRISMNQQINRGRALTKRPHEIPFEADQIFSRCASNSVQSIEQDHTERDFSDLVALIPEVFRDTVLLVDVQGRSYDEAAKQLGVKTGTIRSRLHRGREGLLLRLMQLASDDTPENPDDYLESIANYYSRREVAKKRRESDEI